MSKEIRKGRVLRSFVAVVPGTGKVRGVVGEIIDVPEGVDWLPAGFVELVEEEASEKKPSSKKKTSTKKKSD